MCVTTEQAKEIGKILPYGSKELIAQKLRCREDYVRHILTGNRGKKLISELQLSIIEVAIEVLRQRENALTTEMERINNELQTIRATIHNVANQIS